MMMNNIIWASKKDYNQGDMKFIIRLTIWITKFCHFNPSSTSDDIVMRLLNALFKFLHTTLRSRSYAPVWGCDDRHAPTDWLAVRRSHQTL